MPQESNLTPKQSDENAPVTAQQEKPLQATSSFQALPMKELVPIIVGLEITLLLAALDQTIVSTAMPKIIEQLHGFDRYAWVTTAYLITSTAAVPIFGKLSDLLGRKRILLLGVWTFIITSCLCGLAGSIPSFIDGMNQLILFRGLQGIGGGIITVMVFTCVGDIFPPRERGKYQGLFSGVFAFASVVGPLLGGWITDCFNWQWVFYVNLPVGLAALFVLMQHFPDIRPKPKNTTIDVPGVLLLLGFLVPLLLSLTWASKGSLTSPSVLSGLAVSLAALVAFILVESKAANPILPLSLFKNKQLAICFVSLLTVGLGMFGAIVFIPLFMQAVVGASATQSGSLLTPMMLSMASGSFLGGQMISRNGKYKALILSGFALLTTGMFMLAQMNEHTSHMTVIINMLLTGIGLGFLMPVYTVVVQSSAPPDQIGVATSGVQFFRSIGSTIGTAVFGSIMLKEFSSHALKGISPAVLPTIANVIKDPLQLGLLENKAAAAVSPALLAHLRESMVHSLDTVFLAGAFVIALTFVLNLFLKEIPLRSSNI